jgi:hypothetical protein
MKKIIYTLVFISAIASLSSCTIEEMQQAEEAQSTLTTSKEAVACDVEPSVPTPRTTSK